MDFSLELNIEDVNSAKAIGKVNSLSATFGVDLNRVYNLHGELSLFFAGVDKNKSTFTNVPIRNGGMFGVGTTIALINGMSLSFSGGFFVAKEDRTIENFETGLYVSGRFKYLLFKPNEKIPLFYSISVPVTACFSSFGYHIRTGIALGLDVSEYGRRTNG